MNKFLLACDKFKSEMHLKQPGFTYAACGPFTRKKELKFMQKEVYADKQYRFYLQKRT